MMKKRETMKHNKKMKKRWKMMKKREKNNEKLWKIILKNENWWKREKTPMKNDEKERNNET